MGSGKGRVVVTVLGEIPAGEAGLVLPHEHLFCDLRGLVEEPMDEAAKRLFWQQVGLENHGYLTRCPYLVLDNAVLDSAEIQARELRAFKAAGGGTVVDVTTPDFGRSPVGLKELSAKTGVHIVMGCGHYLQPVHSAQVAQSTVQELAGQMVAELTIGVGDTGIRAGVIGEIGTGDTVHEDESRVLTAACLAQANTGAGLHIHASLWNRNGLTMAKRALEQGVLPHKLCVNHVDAKLDMEYIKALLALGVMVEFDNFGKEFYVDRQYRALLKGSFASDRQRVEALAKLVKQGYAGQLLISNDICLKTMTHTYGGWGYDHIVANILPMMEDCGINDRTIDTIIRRNPVEFLAV